jgi:1-deoxy-D-xylulose-5-phosphate reductoisomerase
MEHAEVQDALKHPNWSMGRKITIDSATLMNKGLEVIEARWLFDLMPEQIQVLIHPQSIIHSMVTFVDGSTLAQLGIPDMRIPILYAFSEPERLPFGAPPADFLTSGPLTFEAPDTNRFPCLALAYEALRIGGTMPAVLNGANEAAVALFLHRKIPFLEIPALVSQGMSRHTPKSNPSLADILEADRQARDSILGSIA